MAVNMDAITTMPRTQRQRSPEMIAILDLIEARFNVGGITWLAQQLGTSKQAVSRWERVPIERVSEVSQITGIPRAQIRPDKPHIFPPLPHRRRVGVGK